MLDPTRIHAYTRIAQSVAGVEGNIVRVRGSSHKRVGEGGRRRVYKGTDPSEIST